jgi:hypothetical protein
MKKLFLTFFIFIFVALQTAFVFPQSSSGSGILNLIIGVDSPPRVLDVEYPSIPNSAAPSANSTLPEYVKYIFDFAIAISGILALVVIVLAGIQYLSSSGMPNKITEAKEKIESAIFGLIILFCSWMLLNTINPAFLKFVTPKPLPGVPPSISSGVYVCGESTNSIQEFWGLKKQVEGQSKLDRQTVWRMMELQDDIKKNCSLFLSSGTVPPDLQGGQSSVWLVPDSKNKIQYGVIIYKEEAQSRNGKVFFGTGGESPSLYAMDQPTSLSVSANGLGGVGFVRPFTLNFSPSPNWYATVYKEINFNERTRTQQGQGQDDSKKCVVSQASNTCGVLKEMRSIEMNGDIFGIFKKGGAGSWSVSDQIDIVETSDSDRNGVSNLYSHLMAEWDKQKCKKDVGKKEPDYYPCADSLIVIAGTFL